MATLGRTVGYSIFLLACSLLCLSGALEHTGAAFGLTESNPIATTIAAAAALCAYPWRRARAIDNL